MYKINGREVLWDMSLADKVDNIRLEMHKPIRRNIAIDLNMPWEGEHSNYCIIIHDGEKYRLYYRGAGANDGVWETQNGDHGVICVAYSDDGKTFYRPNLGLFEYNGSKDNNIIIMEKRLGHGFVDNFSVIYDTNPNCPADEKYKGLSMCYFVVEENGELTKKETSAEGKKTVYKLAYYKSADGVQFEYVRPLELNGAFDSLNFAMWDEGLGQYRLYFRDYHTFDADIEEKIEYDFEEHVRDIRLATSPDFVKWTEQGRLDYGEDNIGIQFYTNCIEKYSRADIFYGIPTRYIDRSPDIKNYDYLPDVGGFRPMLREKYGRSGTAITEATIMTSRDGFHFNRTNEAFLSPGIENGDNWVYGDGYFARGMIETPSEIKGEPNELSLFCISGYRARPTTLERYTIRMDGLFSWSTNFKGGTVLTKPFTFEGSKMSVNFATSAFGYLCIPFCDEQGAEIPSYNSGRLFGNTIDRPCDFEKSLTELNGKTVRMKISMKDAEFYSFIIK